MSAFKSDGCRRRWPEWRERRKSCGRSRTLNEQASDCKETRPLSCTSSTARSDLAALGRGRTPMRGLARHSAARSTTPSLTVPKTVIRWERRHSEARLTLPTEIRPHDHHEQNTVVAPQKGHKPVCSPLGPLPPFSRQTNFTHHLPHLPSYRPAPAIPSPSNHPLLYSILYPRPVPSQPFARFPSDHPHQKLPDRILHLHPHAPRLLNRQKLTTTPSPPPRSLRMAEILNPWEAVAGRAVGRAHVSAARQSKGFASSGWGSVLRMDGEKARR